MPVRHCSRAYCEVAVISANKKQTTIMVDIKSTSNAVWWIKKPKDVERRTTLCQDMTDLFRNISMHGYDKLLHAELFLYEKFIWFCLHVTTLVVVLTMLSYTWDQFVRQYFALNLHDPLYPIENIPFPAISICSNNRISRQAAQTYAHKLRQRDPRNRSVEYFLKRIADFNSLYYKFERDENYERLDLFQTFLDIYGTEDNETFYDILGFVKMLTPKCKDWITKCYLSGKEVECFQETVFQDGLTMYGPCCTFNSKDSYRQRNYTNRFITSELGLTVLLNSSHANDTVSLLNIDGYVVILHNPNDFPDIGSGSAIEVFPMNNEDSFISIKAKFMDTSEDLRIFQPTYRKCYFSDESPDPDLLLHTTYTFSNCLTRCRIRSIAALCSCVPFYMPVEFMDKAGVPYCTLHHVACLDRYNFKWRNVLTQRITILGLERELEEALYCPQCLPSCDDIQYDISMVSLPTDRLMLKENISLKIENLSVLRVYFGEPTALYYKRVISNTWEEAFSTVGNIVSIFLGFSMVALFEMFFFLIKYFCIALRMFVTNSELNSQLLMKGKKQKTKSYKLLILP